MSGMGNVVVIFVVGLASALVAWRMSVRSRVRREQRDALRAGSVVLVHTPDRKKLVATVLSRGPSHFWIELPPGDARWWVPVTAVEPAPENTVRETEVLRRTPRPGPRPALDSET
jgi:type II secretory pathway pseudopilin PulG